MVFGDGKKKETICEYRLFFVIVICSQFFCFAQDIFNKIFSTLGNINKFLFLSLIEKIAFCSAIRVNSILSPKAQRPLVALAYSQMVSLNISATVGCGNTTFLSWSMVMPASMATHAVEMSSEAGLPMRCAPII